mmetsp:Transcript_24339/g.42463  ORF Transcript_24339/g.42463 Transcript_24339/m.42463 type:complete len:476 (+) Transcript_24339:147-1574(+)
MGNQPNKDNSKKKGNQIKKAVPSTKELFQMVAVDESFGFRPKDLVNLYNSFDDLDRVGRNYLDHQQIVAYFKVVETPFVRRVLDIFDHDGNDRIDFREYCITIWTYCALSGADLHVFAFDLYDKDGSGFIEKEEVHRMLSDMYGDNFTEKHTAMKIMKQLTEMEADVGGSPLIDIDAWKEFCRFHRSMLFPAFRLQKMMRERVRGRRYWEKVARRRRKLRDTEKMFPRLHVAREKAWKARRDAGEEINPPDHSKIIDNAAKSMKSADAQQITYGKLKTPGSKSEAYKKRKDRQRKGMKTISNNGSRHSSVVSAGGIELPGTGLETPAYSAATASVDFDTDTSGTTGEGGDLPGLIHLDKVGMAQLRASAPLSLSRVQQAFGQRPGDFAIRSSRSSVSEYEKGNVIKSPAGAGEGGGRRSRENSAFKKSRAPNQQLAGATSSLHSFSAPGSRRTTGAVSAAAPASLRGASLSSGAW